MIISNPYALFHLLLIPAGIIFLMWRNQVRQQALRKVGNDDLVKQLVAQVNMSRRRVKSILWLLTLAALAIAVSHPVWGVSAEIVEVEGRAILFVIDVSRSMDAQDVAPSRLERAKIDITRIIEEFQGDDVGFIVFAGDAFVYMPFTYDTHSIETFLSALSTHATSNQGTDIYPAINLAVDIMSDYSVAEKHIIVMSDGENHEVSTNPDGLQKAVNNGIIIHTIGYGTLEGTQIPLYGDDGSVIGYQADQGNAIVISKLEPAILQEIAFQTGGNYFTSDDIEIITTILKSGNTGILGQRTITQPIERFAIFLLIALIFLSIEIILPETGRITA